MSLLGTLDAVEASSLTNGTSTLISENTPSPTLNPNTASHLKSSSTRRLAEGITLEIFGGALLLIITGSVALVLYRRALGRHTKSTRHIDLDEDMRDESTNAANQNAVHRLRG